ncbi:hypothetical protein [Flavihumibacter sp. CACIAM 22H1]|uniref:hypothetical protein n=1 Tax=Flavihumibacter sp. CACIAM 22H1 TaxID=1812911 RepID=UPI000AF3003A|nr:hypothetical protein [Flavihumibacter sp. CACIAM 22H1]
MVKIVPAVFMTAMIVFSGTVSLAQGHRHSQGGNTTVIVVQDDDDWSAGRKHPKKYKHNKHSREYGYEAHRGRRVSQPPLVIYDTRHLPIRRYSNNRYYYRTQAGLHYWLGRDGRLYLDVKYVNRHQCDDREYAYWERGGW